MQLCGDGIRLSSGIDCMDEARRQYDADVGCVYSAYVHQTMTIQTCLPYAGWNNVDAQNETTWNVLGYPFRFLDRDELFPKTPQNFDRCEFNF